MLSISFLHLWRWNRARPWQLSHSGLFFTPSDLIRRNHRWPASALELDSEEISYHEGSVEYWVTQLSCQGGQFLPMQALLVHEADDKGNYTIEDGYHRLAAAKLVGCKDVLCRVWDGEEVYF